MSQPVFPEHSDPVVWPASATKAAAGKAYVIGPPGNELSHFLTGIAPLNDTAEKDIFILRRNCLQLNAEAETMTVSDAAGVDIATEDFILSFWLKTSDKTWTPFIDKLNANAGYQVTITAAGLVQFDCGDGTDTAQVVSTTDISDGIWHHIAVHGDRSEATGLAIYVDGSEEHRTTTGFDDAAQTWANAVDLVITGEASKTMLVSALALYKGTITQTTAEAEIALLYNALSASSNTARTPGGIGKKLLGTETNLSLALNFDEGQGATCYDSASAGNNGTIANGDFASDGIPIENTALPYLGAFSSLGLSGHCLFPQAVKMGRNNPVGILVAGAETVTVFGHTDSFA